MTFLKNMFTKMAEIAYENWKAILIAFLVVVGLSPLALKDLEFESLSTSISSPKDTVGRIYSENMKRFGDSGFLIIQLEYEDIEASLLNRFTDAFVQTLLSWEDIRYVDSRMFDFKNKTLATAMLRAALLNSDPNVLRSYWERFSEKTLYREISRTRKRILTLDDPELRALALLDILNIQDLLLPFFQSRIGNIPLSQLSEYFDSTAENSRVIFIQPEGLSKDTEYSVSLSKRIEDLFYDVQQSMSGAGKITLRMTGNYALTAESSDILKEDMQRISFLACILVFLLLWAAFGKMRAMVIAFLPLIIAFIIVYFAVPSARQGR